MGGCGSKPKTKDADNEPYGSPRTAAGAAAAAAGKSSATTVATGTAEAVEQPTSTDEKPRTAVEQARRSKEVEETAVTGKGDEDGEGLSQKQHRQQRAERRTSGNKPETDSSIKTDDKPVTVAKRKTSKEGPATTRTPSPPQEEGEEEVGSAERKRPSSRQKSPRASTPRGPDETQPETTPRASSTSTDTGSRSSTSKQPARPSRTSDVEAPIVAVRATSSLTAAIPAGGGRDDVAVTSPGAGTAGSRLSKAAADAIDVNLTILTKDDKPATELITASERKPTSPRDKKLTTSGSAGTSAGQAAAASVVTVAKAAKTDVVEVATPSVKSSSKNAAAAGSGEKDDTILKETTPSRLSGTTTENVTQPVSTKSATRASPSKPLPVPVVRDEPPSTDIKSVNPEMQIFEVLQKSKNKSVAAAVVGDDDVFSHVSKATSSTSATSSTTATSATSAAVVVNGNISETSTITVPDASRIALDYKKQKTEPEISKTDVTKKTVDEKPDGKLTVGDVQISTAAAAAKTTVEKTAAGTATPRASAVSPSSATAARAEGENAVTASVASPTGFAAVPPMSTAQTGSSSSSSTATAATETAGPSPAAVADRDKPRAIPRSVVLLSEGRSPAAAATATTTTSPSSTTDADGIAAEKQMVLPVVSGRRDEAVGKLETSKEAVTQSNKKVDEEDAVSTTPKVAERISRLPTRDPMSPTSAITTTPLPAGHVPIPTARQSVSTAPSSPPPPSTPQTITNGTTSTVLSPPSRSTSTPAASPAVSATDKKTKAKDSSISLPNADDVSGSAADLKDLLIDLSSENRSIVSSHHLHPGTRVKLLQTIDSWFVGDSEATAADESQPSASASGRRVLAVFGRPGSGKTCLAAEVCRRYAARHLLAGSHFFHWRAVGLDHNRTVAVLLSLAVRLADQLAGYAALLPDRRTLERHVAAGDASELFDALISQPLQRLGPPSTSTTEERRRLIVLDAVDECDAADRDLLFQLLNSFDLTSPDWLYLMVTLRGGDDSGGSSGSQTLIGGGRLDRVRTVELRAEVGDADAVNDVKRFLRDPMSRHIDRISLDGALTQLAKNADGNFLCARFLKDRLESMSQDKPLALRDLMTSFPVGLSEICRQVFQGLHDRLAKGSNSGGGRHQSRGSSKDSLSSAYIRVVSLLLTAVEPLPKSAFGTAVGDSAVDELFSPAQMSGTVTVNADDGSVCLAHRAVADWIVSDQNQTLGVTPTAARQIMADAVMTWIGRRLGGGDDDEEESQQQQLPGTTAGGGDRAAGADAALVDYALKHAVYHLTDAAGSKQQENLARILCSLRYVEMKLKVPGVRLDNLLADYRHSHYQAGPGGTMCAVGGTGKAVSLDTVMKRNPGLAEQIDHMRTFVLRRGRQLTRLGADFTVHVAANYSTVARIQDNARFDIGGRPWLEDATAVADTAAAVRELRGTIVDVDLSADERLVAVVTRVDDGGGALLYLLNAVTGEPSFADPIDIKSLLTDRIGLGVRFLPAPPGPSGAATAASAVFVGSLTQFVSTKSGKPVDSKLDLDSAKLSDRYSIECSAVGGHGLLTVGVTTLPWGGRSLHAVVFDVADKKKCVRTVELLRFRFGGSSQYGVKAVALSGDGSLLCACVKQSNRAELKVTVWSISAAGSGKAEMIASADVDDDSLTKCCILGGGSGQASPMCGVLLGSGAHGGNGVGGPGKDAGKRTVDDRGPRTFFWSLQEPGAKVMSLDGPEPCGSLGHSSGQLAVLAQWRGPGSSSVVLSRWKVASTAAATFTPSRTPPDRKYVINGLEGAVEVLATDRAVLFAVAGSRIHFYPFQDLHHVEVHPVSESAKAPFVAADVWVEGLGFVPRSDEPVVAFRPSFPNRGSNGAAAVSVSAGTLTVRGDGIAFGTRLFEPEMATSSMLAATAGEQRVFVAPEMCAYSADGACAVLHLGDTVKIVDVGGGATRLLPSYTELAIVDTGSNQANQDDNKMAAGAADGDNNNRQLLMCVVSPKDPLVGVVYGQQPHAIRIFDVKSVGGSSGSKPIHKLSVDTAAVTDFGFLPSNGCVVSFYRKLNGGTLTVWNQRTGAVVSQQDSVDVVYIRSSTASDRLAVTVRDGDLGGDVDPVGYLLLRNHDNRFGVRLSTSGPWLADAGSSDVEFSGDGTVLIGTCRPLSCRAWNAGNGDTLRTFDSVGRAAEVVGMPTNAHALLHDVDGERLVVVDVTSGDVVAAVPTDGRLARKWTSRRLRVSPRGGVVVGATVDGQLRAYMCHNMAAVKRQTTLQIMKSASSSKLPETKLSTSG